MLPGVSAGLPAFAQELLMALYLDRQCSTKISLRRFLSYDARFFKANIPGVYQTFVVSPGRFHLRESTSARFHSQVTRHLRYPYLLLTLFAFQHGSPSFSTLTIGMFMLWVSRLTYSPHDVGTTCPFSRRFFSWV
jgi:hypothetical protein